MRYIVLFCLLTIYTTSHAQSHSRQYVYCEIQPVCLGIPNVFWLYVDLGLKRGSLLQNQLAVWDYDADQRARFDSRIQSLNFMLDRGWELVEIFTEGESSNPTYFLRFPLDDWDRQEFIQVESKALYHQ